MAYKMQKKSIGIWNRRTGRTNRKRKVGTKRGNGVSDVGKEEREGARRREK